MAGGTPLGQMYIELGLDVSKFNPTLNGAKNAVKYFQSNVKALDSSLKNNGKNTDLLQAKYKTLGQAIEAQRKVLDQMKKSFDTLEPGTAKFDKAAAEIERENAKLAVMEGQLRNVQQALIAVGKENSFANRINKFGDGLIKSGDKIKTFGDSVSSLGGKLTTGLTLPLVASVGMVTKAAVDYESAFAGVKKTVDETATVSYQKLSDGIRQMAKELPASAVEIANVAEVAGQLGIKTEDILSFSRTMIDMGESTNLSAEEAATAIAKIANILGLTSDEYGRFGASVVDLGNNFATTERDIVEMTNRLAAGGKLAGLTAPDILGLATAMSSVGIEAEAGGTAMTQTLTAIGNAVSLTGKGAADDLNLISKTAGMTSEEFQQAWKEKPVVALQSFIKGLKDAQEKGVNMNAILAQLGMTGIRQSNMLKSLALASDKMGDAVDRSNKAWKENTALTNEANKRYETTESQLKIFKNQVTDLAIEFGGPLLKALRDGLKAGKPWIDMLAEMAKHFSSMSEEEQRNVLKWAALTAGAGPALTLFGKGIGIVGGLTKGIGWLTKGTGKAVGGMNLMHKTFQAFRTTGNLSSAFKLASGGAVALGNATASASTSTGLLTTAMSALSNPLGLTVAGLAIATAAAVHFGNEKDKARIKTEEFGSQLSDTARGELRSFQKTVDETSTAVANFGTHAGDAEKVSGAFKKLYEEIATAADKTNKRMEELGAKWGLSEDDIAKAKERNGRVVSNTEAMMNQINEIYQRHNGDASKFSQEEKEIILNNQNEMIKAKLKLMSLSEEQQTAALQALNGKISSLNETQLKHTRDVLKQAMDEEKKLYENSKSEWKELLDGKAIDQETYNKKMQELEANHTQTMEALGSKYYQVMRNLDDKVKARTGQSWNYWEEAKKVLEEYGLSYEEIGKKAAEASQKVGNSHSILANYTSEMSKEVKEANDAWSLLVGNINENGNFEVKSNVKEVIGEAAKSAEGWEQLQFIAKTAEINSNARATIAEALVESGKWKDMTLEEKQVIVKNQAGLQAIFDSETHLKIWNSMPAEVKELLMKNTDIMNKAEEASKALSNYEALKPKQKELLANDESVRQAVARSTDTLTTWNATTPFTKDLKADPTNVLNNGQLSIDKITAWNFASAETKSLDAVDNTSAAVGSAILSVNSPKQETPINLFAADQTGGVRNETSGAINAIKQYDPISILAQNNTQGTVNQVQSGVDSIRDKTVTINAQDNASGVLSGIRSWINSVTGNFFTNIFASRHAHGTNYHPGGLAIVNDQRNSNYKEMVTLPDGRSFIPEGRDVLLPLPKGSKVLRADKTKRLMREMGIPKYATGIGIPSDAKFLKEIEQAQRKIVVQHQNSNNGQDSDKVIAEMRILRASMERILTAILEKSSDVYLDNDIISRKTYEQHGAIYAREGI
ncbi:phage tail tape measure protein [Streptococcus sp. WB01_FAA12]|uniref:phage tail tape measure protein n=1 Tax=Streptococcus sp. WB01_FAA12 TaxID=2725308 RepID=UPI00146BF395|nr:phage tail tape measure protein [Streptococcus sp. WB01_FAA12]NMD84185.1 phage tail tape measure protein [Streptococcus sp. WB01_FAA12]NMD84234.1 phage tail tape measure protein [Streptococcus sp. WB01_FAA12]